MVRERILVFGLGVMVFAGCVWHSNSSTPPWVLAPQTVYSPEKYMTGLGQGQTREQAEKRAYAGVARIFTAHVQADSSDRESYALKERNEQASTERSLHIDHMTRVTTNKVLENVHILESWFRQRDRQYFVLAGLKRTQAEQTLLARLEDLDGQISTALHRGRTGTNTIDRIQGYKGVMRLLGQRPQVNSDLRIVRVSGQGVPAPWSLGVIRQEFMDFVRADVTISVSMEGESARELERAIWEALKQEGLLSAAQSDHQSPSDISITGLGRLWPVDLPDPLFRYVRWCSDIEIREGTSHRLLGLISQSGREGHITEQEARIRASRAMQDAVAKKVASALTQSVVHNIDSTTQSSRTPKACP